MKALCPSIEAGSRIVPLAETATLGETSSGLFVTFGFAILVVFLVLAAQFESFVSAFIVMATVPLGLGCAVIAMVLTGTSLNVYSQIGLVLMVGIIAKNGILVVEFANQLRDHGASVREAVSLAEQKGRIALFLIETPSNPLNTLVDIRLLKRVADEVSERQAHKAIIICDNTLLGPIFQRPLELGADISAYSLTKYVGGHSDLIAGADLARLEQSDREAYLKKQAQAQRSVPEARLVEEVRAVLARHGVSWG